MIETNVWEVTLEEGDGSPTELTWEVVATEPGRAVKLAKQDHADGLGVDVTGLELQAVSVRRLHKEVIVDPSLCLPWPPADRERSVGVTSSADTEIDE